MDRKKGHTNSSGGRGASGKGKGRGKGNGRGSKGGKGGFENNSTSSEANSLGTGGGANGSKGDTRGDIANSSAFGNGGGAPTSHGNVERGGGGPSGGGGSQLRRYFDRAMKDKDFNFQDQASAKKYLDACIAYDDKIDLFFRLASETENGEKLLRASAVRCDVKQVLGFFKLAGSEALGMGLSKDQVSVVLKIFFKADFTKRLLDMMAGGALSDFAPLSWYVLKLAGSFSEARADEQLRHLKDVLVSKSAPLSQQMTTIFGETFDGAAADLAADTTMEEILDPPGSRHDNDHADFRSIVCVPSVEEIKCTREAYLPYISLEPSEAVILDRQFRLLREDFVGPMRECVHEMSKLGSKKNRNMAENQRKAGVRRYNDIEITNIELVNQMCSFEVRFRFPKSHSAHKHWSEAKGDAQKKKSLTEFWQSKMGSRVLARDSVVAIMHKGSIEYLFVVQRPFDLKHSVSLFDDSGPIQSVGLVLEHEDKSRNEKLAAELLMNIGKGVLSDRELVQLSSNLFSYSPVLKSLQQMASIPLADELVHGHVSQETTYLDHVDMDAEVKRYEQQDGFSFDPAQVKSLKLACARRVSLTQGPPGTGKTHLGVRIADIIYRHSSERILCLCYTNHALDDFLGDILKHGMQSIVRIGGRAAAALESYNLRELARSTSSSTNASDQVERRRHGRQVGQLKDQIRECEEAIQDASSKLAQCSIGANCWLQTIEPFLEELYPEIYEELVVQLGDDEFKQIGRKGKALEVDYLWKRWLKGQDKGFFNAQSLDPSSIWRLSKSDREGLKERWENELFEDHRFSCAELICQHKRLNLNLKNLFQDKERRVLQGARIIGCTTTGAAKYKNLLSDAGITVVIIEEAGEVLEAQALATLHDNIKHLIMIGDHQQLRPKLENYSLTVGANGEHNFNVSLFERLIKENPHEHGRLTVQHRMRPEISALIKGTYSDLTDGPYTLDRESIRGLRSNVVFIDHNHNENTTSEGNGSPIKTNLYEVEIVVATVRYLLMNGYTSSQIVVLTPYLGQLFEINSALSKEGFRGTVSDRDENELDMQGVGVISDESATGISTLSVRVATIDNYQGEESDIIIASLVRCNPHFVIGFLSEPERVNVLLSRARIGEIIIGSSMTLRNASNRDGRKLWNETLDHLSSHGQIFTDGLPVSCETHGAFPNEPLISRAAFDRCCANGGCDRPCLKPLSCGHPCPLLCHCFDHKHVQCIELIEDCCPEGHMFEVGCGTKVDPSRQCKTCIEIATIQKKDKERLAKLHKQRAKMKAAADLKRAKAEAETADILRKIKDLKDEEEAILKQTQAEIKTMQMEEKLKLQQECHATDTAIQAADARAAAQESINAERKRFEVEAQAKRDDAKKRLDELYKKSTEGLTKLEKETEQSLKQLDLQASETSANVARKKEAAVLDDAQSALRKKIKDAASAGDMASIRLALVMYQPESRLKLAFGYLKNEGMIDLVVQIASKPVRRVGGESQSDISPATRKSIELVTKGDFFEAVKSLRRAQESKLNEASDSQSDEFALRKALCDYCLIKLGDFSILDNIDSISFEDENNVAIPLHLLVRALLEKDDIRAYTFALASALNPKLRLIPVCVNEALKIVSEKSDKLSACAEAKSAVKNEEDELKSRAGQSEALRKLLKLTGCQAVKEKLLDIKDQISLAKERSDDLSSKQYNALFTGNPGTGKTTVARIYGKVLNELGILPSDTFSETSGAKLLGGGVSALTDLLKEIRDDGVSAIPDGTRVETDIRKKGCWLSGKVTKTNGDGSIDVLYDDSSEGKQISAMRSRVRSLEKGGVLFLDEVYQLQPTKSQAGAQILDILLTEMEEWRGKLVVIFAGYKEPMEDLLEHNEGLPSRFNTNFDFADFTDEELTTVLADLFKQLERYKLEDPKHLRIAARRLGRQRGQVGFGNARAARNLLEKVQESQASRVLRELKSAATVDRFMFTREDILGAKVQSSFMESSKALKDLDNQIGLDDVKTSVKTLLSTLETNSELEEMENPLQEVLLNRLFVGNPGTGKTTIAKIYGGLLKELGFLSKGDVVLKNPSDFIGAALGESEKKTRAILKNSVGCVLVIDEAYGLDPSSGGFSGEDPYKKAVVDTLVAEVQGVPGDDRCVIMCGYLKEMEEFVRNANPGLKRRFQVENMFRFEDYDDTSLVKIIHMKARAMNRNVGYEALMKAMEVLSKQRMKSHFGNGGAVVTLLSLASERAEKRMAQLSAQERAASRELIAADFAPADDAEASARKANPSVVLEGLVGCKAVREQLEELQQIVESAREENRDPLMDLGSLNFVFTGPPGTGKTTVARRMGELFDALEILADGKTFVQCSASDLQTGFVGQAASKTREKFEQAKGGVLFIDEAYRLYDKKSVSFMTEAVDEIVNLLTEDDYKGKIVVILAGYENEIDEMLRNVNPGLQSRITRSIRFDPFDAETTTQLLHLQLNSDKYGKAMVATSAETMPLAQQLVDSPGFASGRDVDTWRTEVIKHCAKAKTRKVTLDILSRALNDILSSRKQVAASSKKVTADTSQEEILLAPAFSSSNRPANPTAKTEVVTTTTEAETACACDGGGEIEDAAIAAALQKACVALGYDKDLEIRGDLEQMLLGVQNGAAFSKDVLEFVCKETGSKESKVQQVLKPQVPALLAAVQAQNKFEIEEIARLEALEEAEKQKAVAKAAKVQEALMGICPAGFQWHREGKGWRCGGGAHWVAEDDPSVFSEK